MLNAKITGKKLRELRHKKNKTIAQVAKDNGISASALQSYENGDRTPRDEVKNRLAKYYGRTVQFLFFTHDSHR